MSYLIFPAIIIVFILLGMLVERKNVWNKKQANRDWVIHARNHFKKIEKYENTHKKGG